MRHHKKFPYLLALVAVALAALIATGCGSSNHDGHTSTPKANAVDRAFVRSMVPHHRSAVQMAKMAQEAGGHRQVKDLAASIVSTQTAEIAELGRIAKSIGAETGDSSGGMSGMSHGDHRSGDAGDLKALGLSQEEAGMSMRMSLPGKAKDFDRVFIDAMVMHHAGAVRMARVELARGQNPELKTLAKSIITAQTTEIKEMNSWRVDWYGAATPTSIAPAP